MDALARLLDGPRGRGAYLLRVRMEPPWAVRIADRAPVGLVAMLQGQAWIGADTGETATLESGDVAIMRGPGPFTFADDPATEPQVVLHPGQRCTSPDGEDLTDRMELGARTWGNSLDGSTVMVIGCYQLRSEVSRRLLAALPTVLSLPAEALGSPLVELLSGELDDGGPGQDAVLHRLFDLLLVSVLRAWFSRSDAGRPAWFQAYGDPVVGSALRMLHAEPAHPWTIASLAAHAGVSRASLAKRFTDLVGEPPMSYLTGWRLALAADQLLDPDATLETVARAVGYSNGFALSTAFKRERGISPKDYRRRHSTAKIRTTGT